MQSSFFTCTVGGVHQLIQSTFFSRNSLFAITVSHTFIEKGGFAAKQGVLSAPAASALTQY